MNDKLITKFAGKKTKEYEPNCHHCHAWSVLPDWLEYEHPKLVNEAVVAKLQYLLDNYRQFSWPGINGSIPTGEIIQREIKQLKKGGSE